MPETRVGIPEISNRRLAYLARIIRPVVSLITLPMGHWPQEIVETYYIKLPRRFDLRQYNFLDRYSRGISKNPTRFVKEARITTYHTPGLAGRVFHPTIAEVLAQIPERYLDPKNPPGCKIVAFETFLEKDYPEEVKLGNSYCHQGTTVLLTQGSPVSGLGRFHYS